MADKHEIKIVIDDNGNTSFEVRGIKGKGCLAVTKSWEEALGIVIKQDKTSEFYQTETQAGITVEKKGS